MCTTWTGGTKQLATSQAYYVTGQIFGHAASVLQLRATRGSCVLEEKGKNLVLKFAKRNLTPTTSVFHPLKIHSPAILIFLHILLPFN